MHKPLLQGHHKNKCVQGVESLLLTLDNSVLQIIKLVVNAAKRNNTNLCIRQGKLHMWKKIIIEMESDAVLEHLLK